MTQTSEEFNAAKKRFEAAWDRDDPAHPINDSAEVQRATQVMHLNKEALTRVGVDLQNIAASLAEAQRSGHISISGLNARLVQIDKTITAEIQKAQADGVQLDWSALKTAAIGEVKDRLGEMNAVRNAYGSQLNQSRIEMASRRVRPPSASTALSRTPAAPQPNGRPGGQPANLNEALDQIAGNPVPDQAIPTPPPPTDPKELEAAKAMIRNMLQEKGLPPDQIESQLNAMLAQAQQGLPPSSRAPDPPRQPPPGFAEGFADRWFSTEQSIKNLLGQGGPGAPGVLESWGGLLQGTAETVVNPAAAAVEEIKNAVNSPSPAYYLGEKTFDAASTAAALPFGGEGAAVRAGLPVKSLVEGGAPEALMRGWDPVGGMPWTEFGLRFGKPDARIWPEDNGFPPGYHPQPAQLPEGTVIDRFGHQGGSYLAPDLTPFTDRALSPETEFAQYNRYEVTGEPLPPGWQIVQGPVEPWFGQTPSPGAVQYMIVDQNGVKVSVKELRRAGVLIDYGPVLGYEIP